ncbi:MAG: succinate-semialdehyde dehydrogenase (NADP+) [Alphaproteobacteria bacterium]|nr:MAG: succinate-semialdehyde dehydrogenase (NADP+) [Caulobacteraceae bacterium]TPW02770.1 MAG: succinate-semialdehyde dehydrogenase (NADP+) [Alphaproteobacteria bacterium]
MISDAWLKDACFIDGTWVPADDGQTITVTNPASGAALGTVPRCGGAETARAIAAASRAFTTWRAMLAKERADLMFALHDALLAEKRALGELLTREQGKSRAEAEGEIAGGAAFFRWFGEEAKRVYGDTIPSPWPGKRILVTKEPVGVVGAITPWNFPHSMIARKLAAALGAGCTMVIKPASQTPLSALAVAAICEKVGFPAGVVNVVTGSAAPIAAEMCENPAVRKITFTGSTEVGKDLGARALANMKRVSMELGGNAPFIVFDDADLDAAVKAAVLSKFRNSGQTCVCTNRFLVQAGVYDAFAEKFAAAVRALKVGDGLDAGVEQGPLIDPAAIAKVEEHITDARSHGARVLAGGVRHPLGGTYFEPTVLADVTPGMKIAREETFGPVAPLFRFETEAEAVAMANDTEFGLAGYFFTRDLGRAWRMMEALEYGMIGVNEGLASTEVAPFGGVKDSGMGREGSKYGLEDYMNVKYALFGGLGA